MVERQGGVCGYTVEREAAIYDDALKELEGVIERTDSVTLLKKIYASGKLQTQVFDKLLDLAFAKGVAEALVEVLELCSGSKELMKKADDKIKNAFSEEVEVSDDNYEDEETPF